MTNKNEAWNIGGGESRLYTEDVDFMKAVRSDTNVTPATYSTASGVYAWQFVLRTELIPLLVRKYTKKGLLILKELQPQEFLDLPHTGLEDLPLWSAALD